MGFNKSQRSINSIAAKNLSTGSIRYLALQWLAILTVTFSVNALATAAQTPTPFTALYQVTKGVMSVGSTKRTLQDKGNGQFVFESVTKPGGIAKLFTRGEVIERSHWRMHDNRLVPHEYTYQNSSDQKRDVQLLFDWEQNEVTNIINGDPWKMELEENTLDKLLYQLAIMYDLTEGKKNLIYIVADGGTMKNYDVKIVGLERVSIDMGDFDAVKVVVTKSNRQTTLWCARDLQFLPVRIEQLKKDDTVPVTANLIELEGIPLPNRVTNEAVPTP